jgi:hypothetical protein
MRFLLAFVFAFVSSGTANAQEANGVIMVVKGTTGTHAKSVTSFSLQTSISQRILDFD